MRKREKLILFLLKRGVDGTKKKSQVCDFFFGGDEEDRTLDLTDANRTLSQLSYEPLLTEIL